MSTEDSNAAQIAAAVQSQTASGCSSMSAVKQAVAAEEQAEPAQWDGPTTAVTPPKNIVLGLVSCDAAFAGCIDPLTGVEQAAKVLGWKYKLFNGNGTASTENADIVQAVHLHVNAIIEVDITPPTIQQGLQAAKSANIPVFSTSSGTESPNPAVSWPGQIVPVADVGPNFVAEGRWQSDWIIANSGGKASVLVLNNPAVTSGVSSIASVDEFNKRCPGCSVSVLNFADSDVETTLGATVVGYLKSHPTVDYVMAPYDPVAEAIIPAMDQAGLKKIQLCSLIGLPENLNYIKTGNIEACDAAHDNTAYGWAVTDQLIRYLDKKPLFQPYGENLSAALLVKSNLPASLNYSPPYNYEAKYEALWGVS